MATLPLAGEVNFEDGTLGAFNSETDTDSKLNVRHFSYLAKLPFPDYIPYRGAYAAEINLAGGTNDAYYQEDDFFDTAAAGNVAVRFYFYATGLTMTSSDRFTIATLQSAGPTSEATISVVNNAGTIQLACGETGATALGSCRTTDLIQGQWHCLEMVCLIDSGVGNDGTITFFVDGQQIGAAITALDQGAIIQAQFGAVGIDAGTTAGRLLFDHIAGDTARIGPLAKRFTDMRILTTTGHAVLGPAEIRSVDLILSSTGDETVTLFDTDTAETLDVSKRVFVYDTVGLYPTYIRKGLYCTLAGTNPILVVKLNEAQDMSEAGVKNLGNRVYV